MTREALHTLLAASTALILGAAPARAQEAPQASKLWDGLRYPAAGRYHDLVTEAEGLLTTPGSDPAQLARAERLLGAAIRHGAARPQAWHVLGRLHERAGRFGRAAEAYAKARSLDPHYQPRALGYAFGLAALRAGRFREAARALGALPRAKDPPRLRATLLNNAAEAYLAAGYLARARKLYREAVIADLRYAPPRWGLAVATHRTERYEQARRLARSALQVDPGGRFLRSPRALFVPPADHHYYEAVAEEALGNPARARAAWQAYLRAAPRSPWRAQATEALRRLGPATARPRPAPPPRRRPPRGRR